MGKERVLEIGGTHPRPYCHRKEIDDFLGLATKQVSSQDAIRAFLHEYLETGIRLPDSARRIPTRSHFFLDPELQALLACLLFTESHRSQRRNRKDDGRNAEVFRLLMIPLQQVRGNNHAFVASHGSEGRASTRGGVARCVYRRVRHTLQEFIDLHSPSVPFDPCGIQIQLVDFGFATRSMDHHVCLERALLTRSRSPDDQVAGVPFDSFRLGPKLNVNAEFASSRYNLADQIGVKARKGTRATMHDSDLRSRTHHHMSKFKGYIPAADKEDSSRKLIQLQELFARRKVLRSRYLQVRWFLSSRNDHIATLQDLLAHLNRRWPDETSAAMECRDPRFRKPLFPVFRNGLRKRPLKAHQLLPINLKLLGLNSFAFHSAGPVDDFRSTHKDLFRVASTQRTGTTERPRINNRYLPSSRATL